MFKNKKTKSKKANLFALTACLSLASLATAVAATSCSQTNKSSNDNANPLNSYSMYSKLTFVAPATPAGVTFSGSTIVKIKTGHMFGTVAHPTPVLDGYQCSGWRIVGGATLEPSSIIDGDTTVEPIMIPIASTVFIDGRTEIYSGFVIDNEGELDVEHDGYKYQVQTTQTLKDSDEITLEVDEEHEYAIESIEQDEEDKTIFYVKPAFTDVPVGDLDTDPADPITLTATITRGAQEIGTATHDFVIRPPYYYADSVTFTLPDAEESTTLDLGNVYWSVCNYDPGEGTIQFWVCSTPDGLCLSESVDDPVEDPLEYFMLYNIPDVITAPSTFEVDRLSASGIKGRLSDIYPGIEITHIHDNFLAETLYYNPELHGGVNEINYIGNSFMRGCTSYNQNINDLFNTISPVTIADYFLADCTSFNNGGAMGAFIMPNAEAIGDGFMTGCTSFNKAVNIPVVTEYIGRYFMADCDNVPSLTIPNLSRLFYFGSNILVNCPALEAININSSNIDYLEDLVIAEAERGSFTNMIKPETFDTGVDVFGSADIVDAILALYPDMGRDPEAVVGPYRHLVEGSV